jgi:hypothetical protein
MKLNPADILKPRADITARVLDPQDPLVKSQIEYTKRQQEIISRQVVDWNNPQLHELMTDFSQTLGLLIPACKFTDPDKPADLPHFELPPLPTHLAKHFIEKNKNLHVLPDVSDSSQPIDGIIPEHMKRVGFNLPLNI